jgi:hypothetical protein
MYLSYTMFERTDKNYCMQFFQYRNDSTTKKNQIQIERFVFANLSYLVYCRLIYLSNLINFMLLIKVAI